MKIYIETDLEGPSGLWKGSQAHSNSGPDYEYGKRCLVRDVNEVVAAAFENGAREVVVRDGHGPGGLNWDQVDPRAGVERSGPTPHWFPSLNETFDCVFLVGAHAMAGTTKAFLEHTQSSRTWFDFKINGQSQGEVGQFAAYAGGYGVPLGLVTGDRAVCQEMSELFPQVVTAEVKYALYRKQCCCHPIEYCKKLLREKTAEAMARARSGKLKPWVLEPPVQLELIVQRVEIADDMPPEYRVAARTFKKTVEDQRLVMTLLGPTRWPTN
jgi:D-amino peptidase